MGLENVVYFLCLLSHPTYSANAAGSLSLPSLKSKQSAVSIHTVLQELLLEQLHRCWPRVKKRLYLNRKQYQRISVVLSTGLDHVSQFYLNTC